MTNFLEVVNVSLCYLLSIIVFDVRLIGELQPRSYKENNERRNA